MNIRVLFGMFLIFGSHVYLAAQESYKKPLSYPIIYWWGYSDGERGEEFKKSGGLDIATIVVGETKDAELVKELRKKNKLFAYVIGSAEFYKKHPKISAQELADYWAVPFNNTLGDKLPGGFDAIAIDEFNYATGQLEIEALKLLRKRYPNKYITIAGTNDTAERAANETVLKAIEKYADLFGLERYMSEKCYPAELRRYKEMAETLNKLAPGLLKKTAFMLGTSQYGYLHDSDDTISFPAFLDRVLYYLRYQNKLTRQMPGIGLWVSYRTYPEYNKFIAKRLIPHYFGKFSDELLFPGTMLNLIKNPGFEREGLDDWSVIKGRAEIIKYSSLFAVRRDHSETLYDLQGIHGENVLMMYSQNSETVIKQKVNVKPGHEYAINAWANGMGEKKYPGKKKLTMVVYQVQNSDKRKVLSKASIDVCYGHYWRHWNRIAATFAGPSNGQIEIEFDNSGSDKYTRILLDFVQLDDLGESD